MGKMKIFNRACARAIKFIAKALIYAALLFGPTLIAVSTQNGDWILLTVLTGIIWYGLVCAWEG